MKRDSVLTRALKGLFQRYRPTAIKKNYLNLRMNLNAKTVFMIKYIHYVEFQTFEKISLDTYQQSFIDTIILPTFFVKKKMIWKNP